MKYTMNLRISHYTEDIKSPGRVGAIVCFYKDGLLAVRPGKMLISTRINEWKFETHFPHLGIVITVVFDSGHAYFQRFRPDLRKPNKGATRS